MCAFLTIELNKTLTGISQYGDFEYTTDGILMRENTAIEQGKLYNNDSLNKLSNNTFNTTEAATGFDISHAKHVPKLGPKISRSKITAAQVKSSSRTKNNENSLCECEDYGKKFMHTGNLERHRESKTCTTKKTQFKQKSENQQCMPHCSAMETTLSKIKEQSVKKQPKQISEQKQEKLAQELKGSAQRRVANKRKATRFAGEQKQIMDRCFDSGVKRKSARYTPAQCQKKWKERLVLTML